jgi:hypothetical protein
MIKGIGMILLDPGVWGSRRLLVLLGSLLNKFDSMNHFDIGQLLLVSLAALVNS